jgi:hypothetical protein
MRKSIQMFFILALLSFTIFEAGCKGHNSPSGTDSSSTGLGTRNGGGASGVPDSTASNMSTDTGGRDTAEKDKGIVP